MDIDPNAYLRPLPRKEAFNAPFWEGLTEREFRVTKCKDCGDWNWIPYEGCRSCLSQNLEWTPISGKGKLMTFSVVHRGPPTFGTDPYGVALVEMDEHPRSIVLLANVVDTDLDTLEIGMPMEIVYEDIPGENITMYRVKAA
ncbi:hypothetical protein E3U23_11510 [Erythrobacter litoralis]|uniref:Zn-ribbon domain-containing OB-fold protein n=1 Tax=Erythrobacter litoralis TaxID=39960 RepID=UPI0024355636|nr:OB-fold domain-containing protein [Erythrobacter litoralis]MDG6079814.1 hypothetical protein [Erythrobacter litoralis]